LCARSPGWPMLEEAPDPSKGHAAADMDGGGIEVPAVHDGTDRPELSAITAAPSSGQRQALAGPPLVARACLWYRGLSSRGAGSRVIGAHQRTAPRCAVAGAC
jgi:hypothetical protein